MSIEINTGSWTVETEHKTSKELCDYSLGASNKEEAVEIAKEKMVRYDMNPEDWEILAVKSNKY